MPEKNIKLQVGDKLNVEATATPGGEPISDGTLHGGEKISPKPGIPIEEEHGRRETAQAKSSEAGTDGAGTVRTTKVYSEDGKLVKEEVVVLNAPPPPPVIVRETQPAPPPQPVPPVKKKGGGRIGIWGAVLLVLVGAAIYGIASIVEHDQCLDCKDKIQYIPNAPVSVIEPSGTKITTENCCPPDQQPKKVEEKPKAESNGSSSTPSESLSPLTIVDGKKKVGDYLVTDPATGLKCYDLVKKYPQYLNIGPYIGDHDQYELVAAMVARESSGNPDAIGPTGDHGILQITPIKATDVHRVAPDGDMIKLGQISKAEQYLGAKGIPYSLHALEVAANHYLPSSTKDGRKNHFRGNVYAFLNLFRGKLDTRGGQPDDYSTAVLENVKVIREARRKRGDYG